MTNNYIAAELSRKREFRVDFACNICNIETDFTYRKESIKSGIKIDTGAQRTLIPLKTLGWSDIAITTLIETAYSLDKNSFSIVRGVESNNNLTTAELHDMSLDDLKRYKGLAVKVRASYIKIGSILVNNIDVKVTTQTTGSVLLGMDVLKNWDIHVGRDRNSDNILLLACPLDNINKDYLNEIHNSFGYIREYQQFKI